MFRYSTHFFFPVQPVQLALKETSSRYTSESATSCLSRLDAVTTHSFFARVAHRPPSVLRCLHATLCSKIITPTFVSEIVRRASLGHHAPPTAAASAAVLQPGPRDSSAPLARQLTHRVDHLAGTVGNRAGAGPSKSAVYKNPLPRAAALWYRQIGTEPERRNLAHVSEVSASSIRGGGGIPGITHRRPWPSLAHRRSSTGHT